MRYFLNQIEKRFQFILDTSWTLISQVILTVLNALLVFFLANLLDPHDFGQFKFVTTWGALAFGIGYTGYTYIITQKFVRNETVYLGTLYKNTIKKSWYVFFILSGAAVYYFLNFNSLLALGFFLTIFTTVTALLSPLASCFYVGKRKIILNTNIQLSITTFQVISVLIISYLFQNIYWTLILYLLSTCLGYSISILYAYKKNKDEIGTTKISKEESVFETESANKLNMTSIISTFAYNLDKLLIFHFLGSTQLAIYSIAVAISDQLRTPFKALSVVLLPRFNSLDHAKKKAFTTFIIVTAASSILTLIFLFINPLLFTYFFPKYAEYVFISNLSILIIPLSGAGILSTYLQSEKDYSSLSTNTIIMIVSMLTLYSISAYFKNLELFIIGRNLTALACFSYTCYRFYSFRKSS